MFSKCLVIQIAVGLLLFSGLSVFGAAPHWKESKINLGTQLPGKAFELDLNTEVNNPDGFKLSFYAGGLPKWMKLDPTGKISGTPVYGDIGIYYGIFLQLTGPGGVSDEAEGYGRVEKVAIAPLWKGAPVVLIDAKEDALYENILGNHVDNPDKLPLNFSFADSRVPKWLNLTNVGRLFGIPRRDSLGHVEVAVMFRTQFEGEEYIQKAVCRFEVKWTNKAPSWAKDPQQLPDALSRKPYAAELIQYVTDPDLQLGDLLRFEIVSGPRWAVVSPLGSLTGTPLIDDVGDHSWEIKVIDANGLEDLASVEIRVLKGNLPPEIKPDISFKVKERENFSESLNKAQFVVDPDGDSLVFSMKGTGPVWGKLDKDGKLVLQPGFEHIGQHSFRFSVSDGKLSEEGGIKVEVIRDPRPPLWPEDPFLLEAVVGKEFSETLVGKAVDLDKLPITFLKIQGPDWLFIEPSGKLIGKPGESDSGDNQFKVSAKNDLLSSEATLVIKVKFGNRPPKWMKDPLVLEDIQATKTLNLELSTFVQDPDGDALKFNKIQGPSWLTVQDGGSLSAIPSEKDVGDYSAVVEVSDGLFQVQAGLKGKVLPGNKAPIIHKDVLQFSMKEREVLSENLGQLKYVEDPDGDRLAFKLVDSVSWVTLDSLGHLSVKPLHAHVGDHSFRFEVSDGKFQVQGVFLVKVSADPRPPIWLQDPIAFSTQANQPFEADIFDKAKELDGKPITFSKVSGPEWLLVGADGKLSGVAGQINMGENKFTLGAQNSVGVSNATLVVTVRPAGNEQSVTLESSVAGAPSEIIWVVDNSLETSPFLGSFAEGVKAFYANLDQGQVRHASSMISSREWVGLPVQDESSYLLRWNEPGLIGSFLKRLSKTQSTETLNSPIWALDKFQQRAPLITDIFKKGYFSPEFPMEVFIFTAEDDEFKVLSQGTSKSGYDADAFAGDFIAFHRELRQPLTITAVDLRCPSPIDPSNPASRPHYLSLTLKTLGTYFHHTPECDDRLISVLANFAYSVKFRANVFAKNRVKLKKYPFDPRAIKVFLNHFKPIPLSGNSGSPDDLWFYNADTNEVVIHWYLIRTPVNSGDTLSIEY